MRKDNTIIKPSAENISNGKYISKVFIILRSLASRNSYGPGLNSNSTNLCNFCFCFFCRKDDIPHFTFNDFLTYLFSYQNDILNPSMHQKNVDEAHADAPLSHYFINSSHNSYLTGLYSAYKVIQCRNVQ